MFTPKPISQLTQDELAALLDLFDSNAFIELFVPVLVARQEELITRLVTKNDEELRGRIKAFGEIITIRNAVAKIVADGQRPHDPEARTGGQ